MTQKLPTMKYVLVTTLMDADLHRDMGIIQLIHNLNAPAFAITDNPAHFWSDDYRPVLGKIQPVHSMRPFDLISAEVARWDADWGNVWAVIIPSVLKSRDSDQFCQFLHWLATQPSTIRRAETCHPFKRQPITLVDMSGSTPELIMDHGRERESVFQINAFAKAFRLDEDQGAMYAMDTAAFYCMPEVK